MGRKLVKIGGKKVSYWDTGAVGSDKAVVVLPPGAWSGEKFSKLYKYYPVNTRLIIPDYLGRGSSSLAAGDVLNSQAKTISLLLKKLKLKNNTLLGVSYGTVIATKVVQLYSKGLSISKLVLIAPGEFFISYLKIILKLFFIPAKCCEIVRKLYRYIINKIFPGFIDGDLDLHNILKQWNEILDYRIDTTKPIGIDSIVIVFDKDKIVDKKSISKILTVCKHYKVYYLNYFHPKTENEWYDVFRNINKFV